MKPFLSAMICLAAFACLATAETHVPAGPVSGIWNAFNSPYLIEGNINIPAGDTLTMMPGTVVTFTGGFSLDVYGMLNVNGQPGGPAETVNIQGGSGIHFLSTAGQSRVQYSILTGVSLYLGPTPTTIDHCTMPSTGIVGTGSSGNLLTYSRCRNLIAGSNWTVIADTFDYELTGYNPFWLSATCIANANGTFINNVLRALVINSSYEGSAVAIGFSNCDGTIASNVLNISAFSNSGSYNSDGIAGGSGICRNNSIQAQNCGIHGFNGEISNCTVRSVWTGISTTISNPSTIASLLVHTLHALVLPVLLKYDIVTSTTAQLLMAPTSPLAPEISSLIPCW